MATAKEKPSESVNPLEIETSPKESVYTADELAANCKLFRTSHEIVVVALRKAGKKTATFSEAQKIIEKFKNKEVKL